MRKEKKKTKTGITLLREIIKGKTLSRTLQNIAFSKIELSGSGIDLGSKTKNSSYYRFLDIKENTKIVFTDLYPKAKDILKVDLENKFPIENNSFDFIILTNVLEHLYNYNNCLSETHRILKTDGLLIGTVPFLHKIHYDPDDFFRYTKSSLTRIFKDSGFKNIKIIPLGYGAFTAGATLFARILRIKILIYITYMVTIGIDKFLAKLFRRADLFNFEYYPLSYIFICNK